MLTQLNLFEFAVIYLALGAPLGVYHLVTHWGGSTISAFSFAAVNVCIWPAAALVYLFGHVQGHEPPFGIYPSTDPEEALLRRADTILTTDELFTFRESISRYVAVCDALNSPIGTSTLEGLLDIAGPNKSAAASACAIRRNRTRLSLHQLDARTSFVETVASLRMRDPLLLKLARDLAAALGDHIGLDELDRTCAPFTGNIHISSDRISIAA